MLVIGLALLFDFSNGWHDSANAIATVVSTRVLSPVSAVMMAGVLNVAGAFMSTAVAKMVGKGIIDPSGINDVVIVSALGGAIIWNLGTSGLGDEPARCFWFAGQLAISSGLRSVPPAG